MAAAKPPSPDPGELDLDLGFPEPPELDIPELSLPAAATRGARAKAATPAPAAPSPAKPAGSAGQRGAAAARVTKPAANLQLDFQASPPLPGVSETHAGGAVFGDGFDDFDLDGPAPEIAVSTTVPPEQQRRPLPTGLTPDADALAVTAVDSYRASGYGPIPAAWYLTPPYSIHVFRRRRALRAIVADLAKKLEAAERSRDTALDDLVGTLWSRLEGDRRFDEVLEQVRVAEREAAAASESLASTNTAFRTELKRIELARAKLEEERSQRLEVERQQEGEHAQRERGLARAEARLQRIAIEQRNNKRLEEQAAQPESGVRLPPDHAARTAELAAQVPEATEEVNHHRALTKEAAAQLRAAQAETQRVAREIGKLDAERRGLEGKFASESSSLSVSVAAAEKARLTARADVGRALLRVDVGAGLPERDLETLRAHDELVRRAAREHLAHIRGIDAYDRQAVQRGALLIGGGALLVVLLLVLLVLGARGGTGDDSPALEDDSSLHG
jgi:hypothetical protein